MNVSPLSPPHGSNSSTNSGTSGTNLGKYPLLHNVVILPDGTVTWSAEAAPEVVPAVDCEIVLDWYPIEFLRIPQPQPPEIFVTAPEFTSTRVLNPAGRI
jgi:hypothetical protein